MMLTPVEVRNQKFEKGFRGYREQEVNGFLFKVAEEYEELYRENVELKERLQRLEFELAKYRKMEETLNQSLLLAQQTAEEVKAKAGQEADLMLQEAKKSIAEMFSIYEDILKRLHVFKTEMKSYLMAQVELIDNNEKRINDITNFFYSRDMKEILDNLSRVAGKDRVANAGAGSREG
ncbi:MAG: DivIVA domain-containing protein [Syntrophomonadaceae bacterium]|nr:DivIVA domain-containing protein [Syntrophomonadaceae bacterium]